MTDQEFIKKWKAYCALNGVTATPEIEEGDGLSIEGYTPPTYLVWHTATGKVEQGVSMLQMTDNPQDYLRHVQFAYGVPLGERVTWRDFLNPPAPAPNTGDPMVGDVFDASRRLFYVKAGGVQEGAKYRMPSGREFVAVRIAGPFTIHWQEK